MEKLLTPENIAFVLGILLSIVFEVVPPAKAWFDKLTSGQKFLFLSGGGLIVVAAFFILGCIALFGLDKYVTCDALGAQDAFLVWLAYFLASQGTFGTIHTVQKERGVK